MDEETKELDYMNDYNEFIQKFKLTEVSAEEVGALIMHQTNYYIRYNVKLGDALRKFSAIKANFQSQPDPQTGKAISSSKAEILADNTTEANIYEMARIHVNNIQEIINSMKSLQKGIMNEYAGSQ